MKLRSAVSAVALALVSVCSAQAAVYTYTGNLTEHDYINSAPTNVVAHFEFDFENSVLDSYDIYDFKSWDVSYGGMKFSSAAGDNLSNRFTFDASKNVTGWYFDAGNSLGFIQSISANFIFFAPNGAHDIIIQRDPLASAAVYDNQGTWSIAPSVPEPATYLMLGLGLAAVGYASRKRLG